MLPYVTAKSSTTTTTANFTQDRVSFQALRELHYGQSKGVSTLSRSIYSVCVSCTTGINSCYERFSW